MQQQHSTGGSFDQIQAAIHSGGITRRIVLQRAMALGLAAPAIAALLTACGGDDDDESTADDQSGEATVSSQATATSAPATPTSSDDEAEATPTTPAEPTSASSTPTQQQNTSTGRGRGVGDLLRILYWQAPALLNPHISSGTKDSSPTSIVLEPLIDVDAAGNLVAVLAAEVPSLENGGVAADGMSVAYTLKEGVVWSDGEPFTANDVRFTWEYATDPDGSITSFGIYDVIEDVEVIDDRTVTLHFKQQTPGWYGPFCTSYSGQVLPEHLLREYIGERAMDAPFNLNPIGTGPYKVTEFRPGDTVLYEINETYREPDKPYFSEVEWKGGGDAAGAARAALQSGEAHWAWNLQVEKAVLEDLATAGEGIIVPLSPINVELMAVQFADPRAEGDLQGEPSTTHPILSDRNVRRAFALGVDRETITNELYGAAGTATANVLNAPEKFASTNTTLEYDLDAGNALLDEAGWVRDGNRRSKDGLDLAVVHRASINSVRQRMQDVLKAAWGEMGIETEIEAIDASVFFSTDPGNPDTFFKFFADFEIFFGGPSVPFPINWMATWKSTDPDIDLSQRSNDWTGLNYFRWVNEEYNQLYTEASIAMDEDRQVELFVAMNDLVVSEVATIAIVARSIVAGVSTRLKGYNASPWTADTRDIADWYWEE